MGCAASRTGENGDEDGDDDFFDDYGEEEEEEDDLDDLRSQPGDTPLLAIDRLALDEEAGTGPQQQQQQRYQAAPPVQPTTVPAPLAVTASTDDTLVALATSMGSSRRRWDDEEAVAEQSTVAAPPRPLAQDPAALPDTLPAKKMVFMTAGSAFKHRSAEYSSSLTPTVPALVDATQPTAVNPLAAPLPVDQRRSSSTAGKPRSRPSNMTMDEVAMSPPIPLDWDAPECLSVDMLLRRATQEQRGYWKNQPAVPPPVMGRLTHPGLKGVEQWLAETGATPQAVPSLVSSPLGSDQLLNRRALNSNDRIIRSIVERRRASVSSAQSDDDDDNARRRSSSRFRKVPMEATVDDGGIMSELAALQDQIDAADDDEGDNSSKHTVRSEDGVLSIRPSSRMSGHHPAPRLSPAQRVNSRA